MEKVPSLRPAVDASGMSTSCGRHRGGTTKPSAHDTLPLAFPLSLPHSPDSLTPVSFFFFPVYLSYFTILYWFCHTLT